jgi:hypothetical protein
MIATSLYIYDPATGPGAGQYQFDAYLEPSVRAAQVRVGDQVTDSVGNRYLVVGYDRGGGLTHLNSLFTDGAKLHVEPAPGSPAVLPVEDADYDSVIQSLVIPQIGPSVSWQSIPSAVSASAPAYTYVADLSVELPGDPGAGTAQVGDMFVDNLGNLYEIVEWAGNAASPRHAKLRELAESGVGPNTAGVGYVYRPREGAPVMAQAQFVWLSAAARDRVNNYEKSVLWQHRGVRVGTTQVTELQPGNGVVPVGDEDTAGWAGGNIAQLDRGPGLFVAGEVLSGHKLVMQAADGKVYLASHTEPTHASLLVGITTHAADEDAPVYVHRQGLYHEPSWSWTAGSQLYLGEAGALTHTPPASGGFILAVGRALTESGVFFEWGSPIFHAE